MNVNEFLSKIGGSSNNRVNFEKQRKIEKIYLSVKEKQGRYQVLPIPSVVTNFPFVELPKTREVNMPRKNVHPDGTESTYNAWIKFLPLSAYTVRDETGREVSSLTAADEALLRQAYAVHEELCQELDFRNNAIDPVIGKLLRIKNYTLFHAHCMNWWSLQDQRTPARQNFDALFVITGKNFGTALKGDVENYGIMNTCPDNWLDEVYNRELSNRSGFMMFTVQNDSTRPGFTFTVAHATGKADYLQGVQISQEDMDLMSDPIEAFLGWQANPHAAENTPVGQRRLFNEKLIRDAVNFMSMQLQEIRMSKQAGNDPKVAIEAVNERVLNSQVPTDTMGHTTNDPLLADLAKKTPDQNTIVDAQDVISKNQDPFATPPSSQIDPITGMPIGSGDSKPSSTPDFTAGFGSSMPF